MHSATSRKRGVVRCARRGRERADRRSARGGPAAARPRGFYSVEFAIVLLGSLSLFVPIAEFLRLSLYDQTLARAAHQAARAAGADPVQCEAAIRGAFQPQAGETLIGWLLDTHGDGSVGLKLEDAWPDPTDATEEVLVDVTSDSDIGTSAVDWRAGCRGHWIRLRARIVVQPWSPFARALWPDGFGREHVSWARNQEEF